MYRKCYQYITESISENDYQNHIFGSIWKPFWYVRDHGYIVASNITGRIEVAPLMVLHLPLLSMKKYNDAVKFNLQFTSLDEIESMPDKLRWHRYHKGLYQFEVAEYLGVERQTYSGYEEPDRDFCPPEHIAKLAELYGVPAEDLTDEYNLFIYRGQGKQLVAKRKKLGLTREEYAARLGTSPGNLRKWEKDEVRMVKRTWERYFK